MQPGGRSVGVSWSHAGNRKGKLGRHHPAALHVAANVLQVLRGEQPGKAQKAILRPLFVFKDGRGSRRTSCRCRERPAHVRRGLQRERVVFVADVLDLVLHAEHVLRLGAPAGRAWSDRCSSATITSYGRFRSKLCTIQSR